MKYLIFLWEVKLSFAKIVNTVLKYWNKLYRNLHFDWSSEILYPSYWLPHKLFQRLSHSHVQTLHTSKPSGNRVVTGLHRKIKKKNCFKSTPGFRQRAGGSCSTSKLTRFTVWSSSNETWDHNTPSQLRVRASAVYTCWHIHNVYGFMAEYLTTELIKLLFYNKYTKCLKGDAAC